jgi:hypothetical protein
VNRRIRAGRVNGFTMENDLLKMEANRGNLMETEEPIQASRGY